MLRYDIDVEKRLLGYVFHLAAHDNPAPIFHQVTISDLMTPTNRAIYETMMDIYLSGRDVDIENVHAALTSTGTHVTLSDLAKLSLGLPVVKSSSSLISSTIEGVKRNALVRTINEVAGQIQEHTDESGRTDMSPDELIVSIRSLLDSAGGIAAPMVETLEAKYHRHAAMSDEDLGERVNIRSLQRFSEYLNLRKKRLIVIAGRPKRGKTAITVHAEMDFAMQGLCGVVFNLEMPDDEMVARSCANLTRQTHISVPKRIIQDRSWNEEQRRAVDDARKTYFENVLCNEDGKTLTINDIASQLFIAKDHFQRRGKRLDWFVVDYVNIIRPTRDESRLPKYERVGDWTLRLRQLAKELNCLGIMLTQLNRDAEGQTPTLAHLRESGKIEEHADAIIALDRDDKESGRYEDYLDVHILANRGYWSTVDGALQMIHYKDYSHFMEV